MLALLALSTALAGEITWTFEAQSTASVDAEFDGQIPPGTALTGFITFDEPDDTTGTYQDAVLDAEFTALGLTWTVDAGGAASVRNETFDSFSTGWTFAGPSLVGSAGRTLAPSSVNVFVSDNEGGVFDSLAFPIAPPDLEQVDTNQLTVQFFDSTDSSTRQATFEITAWQLVDSCPDSPKTSPDVCGCAYEDVDVTAGLACVHFDATVDGAAILGHNVQIDQHAVVSAATIGTNGRLGRSALVGDGSVIGSDCIVSRSAVVGANVTVGDGCLLQRTSHVEDDVTIGTDVYLGYGAGIGAQSTVGDNVVMGAFVNVDEVNLGNGVVLARGVSVGARSSLGAASVVGPDVQIGQDVVLGERVRIRKEARLGDRVTLGEQTKVGRNSVFGDDSGTRENVAVRAEVVLGTFAHLPADLLVQRGESFPNDYDHDDDGALSVSMGGTDCNDLDARFIELCEIDVITMGGARSWADGTYAPSCDGYRNPTGIETYSGDVGSGLYNIDPDGDGTPFPAYCDMATSTGWTLAAVIAAGSGSSWTYDSPWWTVSGSAQHADPSPSAAEARYQVFDDAPYSAIRLVDPASGREVRLMDSAASLVSLFATTPAPVLSDNGLGGHNVSGRTTLPHTRYDTQAFGFLALNNALNICGQTLASDTTGWVAGSGIGVNTAGRYDATNGLFASGKVRLGNWTSGSNSHIWEQTADCGFGLGAQTSRNGTSANTGTTMGAKTTVWIQ